MENSEHSYICSKCFRISQQDQIPRCSGCVNSPRRVCLECCREYLLETLIPSCPICYSHWDYHFLQSTFSSQWVSEVYLTSLKKSLLKREKRRLPLTLTEIEGDHIYVFHCTRVSCKGMIIFDRSECVLCRTKYCLWCGEVKGEHHRCQGRIKVSPPPVEEDGYPYNPYYLYFNSQPLCRSLDEAIRLVRIERLLGCPLFPRDEEIISIYYLGVDLNSLFIQSQEEQEQLEEELFKVRKRWIKNQMTGTEFQQSLYQLELKIWSNLTQFYLSRASRDVVVGQINQLYQRHSQNTTLDLERISCINEELIRVVYPLIKYYNSVSREEMKLSGSKRSLEISLSNGNWILRDRGDDITKKTRVPVI